MGIALTFHGVALAPPKIGCKDLSHHVATNQWNLWSEHGVIIEVAQHPPVAQHLVVCPKTPWQCGI